MPSLPSTASDRLAPPAPRRRDGSVAQASAWCPLSFGAGPFFAAGGDGILRTYRLTQLPSESEDAP